MQRCYCFQMKHGIQCKPCRSSPTSGIQKMKVYVKQLMTNIPSFKWKTEANVRSPQLTQFYIYDTDDAQRMCEYQHAIFHHQWLLEISKADEYHSEMLLRVLQMKLDATSSKLDEAQHRVEALEQYLQISRSVE
jgi:glycyl-tRNA synthetase alpha subunit